MAVEKAEAVPEKADETTGGGEESVAGGAGAPLVAHLLAVQRAAGNRAATAMLQRHPHAAGEAMDHTHGPGGAGSGGRGTPQPEPFIYVQAEGDDPMALITNTTQLFEWCDSIQPTGQTPTAHPEVFRPLVASLHFEDYIVTVDRTATPMLVDTQPNQPIMIDVSRVFIQEPRSGQLWSLALQGEGDARRIRASPVPERVLSSQPVEAAQAGASRLVVFVPGMALTDPNATALRARIPGSAAAGGTGGPPPWATTAVAALRRRRRARQAGGPNGVEGGRGTGNVDRGGTGGGGLTDAPDARVGGDGQPLREGATAGGGGDGPTPPQGGAPGAERQGAEQGQVGGRAGGTGTQPLQGPPTFTAGTTPSGTPQVAITIDRATTVVALREGETPAALDARVDAAIQALQDSRDPNRSTGVRHGVTQTGFQAPPPGQSGTRVDPAQATSQAHASPTGATPGERLPGARGGANAPRYPSHMTFSGERRESVVTTLGATNGFGMLLEYAAMSLGMQDEVFNRMQPVSFYWELIDVGNVAQDQQRQAGMGAEAGSGTRVGAGSGAGRDIGRTLENVAEDQENDLQMMRDENWSWEARAGYLTVIGLSNSVRMIGSLISSFVALVTQPLNERSMGFDAEGEFVLRCVATPQVSDAARADPDHHVIRASSVAVMPIKVMELNARARAGVSAEERDSAALEDAVTRARDDDERRLAQARLEAFRRRQGQSGLPRFQSTLQGLRAELATARQVKILTDGHVPEADPRWGLPELQLQIALLVGREDVDARIRLLGAQLRAIGGEGADEEGHTGEHERWVTEQAGAFKAGREFRPRVVLASEENGQVTEVQCMLGELAASTDEHPRWRLVDITSPSSRDHYDGDASVHGTAGHQIAIRGCFRQLAEACPYGRGTLALRLPAELRQVYGEIALDPAMRSAHGAGQRALRRLQDLATVAEIAGIVATGGVAGAVIGAVGGIAGATVAIESLIRRSRTGHVIEVGTLMDVLGVVGGLASVAGVGTTIARSHVDALTGTGRSMPSWLSRLEGTERALHIHGMIGNLSQVMIIPYQLLTELNQIDEMPGEPGQRDARRALALLQAIRSGTVTFIQAAGGLHLDETPPVAGEGEGAPGQGHRSQGQLPEGFRGDEAHGLADGSGAPQPPLLPAGHTGEQSAQPGHDGQSPAPTGAQHGGEEGGTTALPSAAELAALARQMAEHQRARSEAAVDAAANGQAGQTGEGTGGTGTGAGTGGTEHTGQTGEGGSTAGQPGHGSETAGGGTTVQPPSQPGAIAAEVTGGRQELLGTISGRNGAEPSQSLRSVRESATQTESAADPDAVRLLREAGDLGVIRRETETVQGQTEAQQGALKARIQEARLAVTNDQVRRLFAELQAQHPDLTFEVQDLGTVGFGSDRDITVRVTPRDEAAYRGLGDAERAAVDRQMIAASADAVPRLYRALEEAGFPAARSLDTNFYTELHEGRVRPRDAAEGTQIAADQQIVSLSEIIINAGAEGFHEYVAQQRAAIEALRGRGTPDRDITDLSARLDQQVAAAEASVRRLLGELPEHGHPGGDARDAALAAARSRLVEALRRTPPPEARELRQLMADVKLLEPDAYGTRAAVEGVVLGMQGQNAASLEAVRRSGYRTRLEIERNEGSPGPQRLDPATGAMREVTAEEELTRRRTEAGANVGVRRPGDERQSSYDIDARRLQVAEAVYGHLLGHTPDPASATPSDASSLAKNLGRIVGVAGEAQIASPERGLGHLHAIVDAKNAGDSATATRAALAGWAGEASVRTWARGEGISLTTEADHRGAFVRWGQQQAATLMARLRIRTETAALHGSVAVGSGGQAGVVAMASGGDGEGGGGTTTMTAPAPTPGGGAGPTTGGGAGPIEGGGAGTDRPTTGGGAGPTEGGGGEGTARSSTGQSDAPTPRVGRPAPAVRSAAQDIPTPRDAANGPATVVIAPERPSVVREQFGDTDPVRWRGTWPGDGRAFVMLEEVPGGAEVSDIFRGTQLPPGSAPTMLAAVLRRAGITEPSSLAMTHIMDTQPTLTQLQAGTPPADTVLGRVLVGAAAQLGATVTGWEQGVDRSGKPWLRALLSYPSPPTPGER